MIEVRMIYDLEAVIKVWPIVSKDMTQLMNFCHRDMNLDIVFNDIVRQNALLWLIFRDEKYVALIITKVIMAPLGDKSLLIYGAYSKEKLEKDEFAHAASQLNEFAKDQGCTDMEFYTIRDKAFERRMKEFNWEPKYTLFRKEVK